MQNINLYGASRSIPDEVVEDSEPEREALRQTQRQERKRRKLAAMNGSATTTSKTSLTNVIFISDDSLPASPVVAASGDLLRLPRSPDLHKEHSAPAISVAAASGTLLQLPQSPVNVIDISDSSTNISADIISLCSSAAGTNLNGTAADKTNASGAPLDFLLNSGHSDDEEILPTLNLGRFAFANSNPRPLRPQNSVDSASSSDSQPKPAAKKTARSSSKGLAEEFSDAALSKLVKCVSCDLSWTARKTAAQKMELDNAPDQPGPSNRKGKAVLVPSPRTTLLEDIVREAGPKRKGKRKEVVDILKPVSETRENIRGNARMLLGPELLSDGDSFPVQTQAVTANKPAAAQENRATQAFGTSRLGQQYGLKPSLLGEPDSDGEPDLPPATQAFAPSKFGSRPAARGWGYESESEAESSPPEPDVPAAENPLDLLSFSAKELSLRSSPKTKKKKNTIAIAPTFPAIESDRDESESELNREPFLNTVTSQKPKKSKNSTRKTPTKRSRKKAVDEFDESWELRLKDKILADHDLHLRILRYEPIHFDIFLKLATATEDEVTGLLKLKLRIFLDKQAINFVGETTQRQKRR